MPLFFPIAPNAREALDAAAGARTLAEARELARTDVSLVSDWLRPRADELETVQAKADAGVARGFVQFYEDAKGRPVIAVSYWKPVTTRTAGRKSRTRAESAETEDHTDDLYFTKPGARRKRRRKAQDPQQLDLFGPDQQGAESRDPNNPGVVIVDEEGDGASFGGVDQPS